jgi:tripartite-type tricarboxylate transporter receptor subunit TctC
MIRTQDLPALRSSAVLLAACALVPVATAQAQSYPVRPVRMILTLAPGGPVDALARMLAVRFTEQLGQQFVVDNRPGAGGSVGGEAVARANRDGHTLLLAANGTIAVAPHLIRNLSYDAQRDLAPISNVVTSPLALVVNPSVPAQSVKELIALAKAKPNTINFASSGNGSTGHLAVELLKAAAKIELVHVPYRGAGPAMTDLIAGQTQMQITAVSGALQFIKSGKLRALGVTAPKRLKVLPELPAIAETLPGYEVISWYGLLTTAGTPPAIIARLNEETVKAVANPELANRLTALGLEPETSTPEAFGALIRSESAKWGKLIKTLGIKI